MITADPQLEDVKTALKLGAYDFVGKPLDFDELAVAVKNALETTRLRSEVESLRGEVRRRAGYHNVIGVSQKMSELLGFVSKIATSEATTILVQGESGTGKDLIAKAIHYQSRRQDKPFVAINCSAIPETLMAVSYTHLICGRWIQLPRRPFPAPRVQCSLSGRPTVAP